VFSLINTDWQTPLLFHELENTADEIFFEIDSYLKRLNKAYPRLRPLKIFRDILNTRLRLPILRYCTGQLRSQWRNRNRSEIETFTKQLIIKCRTTAGLIPSTYIHTWKIRGEHRLLFIAHFYILMFVESSIFQFSVLTKIKMNFR